MCGVRKAGFALEGEAQLFTARPHEFGTSLLTANGHTRMGVEPG